MTGRDRFIDTINGKKTDSSPIWLMRQAGRYLPEYRQLRAKYGFKQLVTTPEMATEVTLQPLRRFDLDAAIIFSDILVVPEAMGQPFFFKETKGIGMEYSLKGKSCVDKLDVNHIEEKLGYVGQALQLTKNAIQNKQALLGFGGSPWTLAAYMVEGGSSQDFPNLMHMAKEEPKLLDYLMEKLCQGLIKYFKMQIRAGIDALQIFDTWGILCKNAQEYWDFSLKWVRYIIQELPQEVPVIFFAKGMGSYFESIMKTGAKGFSLGPQDNMQAIRQKYPGDYILQGNLDPSLMHASKEDLQEAATTLLQDMLPFGRHIVNLGHGMMPNSKIENVQILIDTVRGFKGK